MIPVYLSHAPAGTFQVALMFCGYLPTTHSGLVQNINAAAPFNDIRALVFYGTNDWIISNDMTREQASKFTSPTVLSSSADHTVPSSSDPTFNSVVSFLTCSNPTTPCQPTTL